VAALDVDRAGREVDQVDVVALADHRGAAIVGIDRDLVHLGREVEQVADLAAAQLDPVQRGGGRDQRRARRR
jgi:hypothetical protein